ncbi:hypothetical protein DENSPDRAFT_770644 [Dentipellis sp. KUC8613]|nr:hypothetical protein DENSPDRAFT_770644 [Dentipellis sp. KUC8613]
MLPLDESLYQLTEEEIAFYKDQTGIQDEDELKKHIVACQAEAYKVAPYPCIRSFSFVRLKISRLPAYKDLLKLGKERKGAIFLDIGCCFGNDVRKAVADGYPVENTVASDLYQGLWDAGVQLFKKSAASTLIPFIPGDVFDPAHLAPVAPFTAASPPTTPAPDLRTLASLNPLRGHVSAVHASSFFHLFDEAQQLALARALAGLLAPAPGSVIFGRHHGLPQKTTRATFIPGRTQFCHSPESWKELWDGEVFEKGTVRVEAEIEEMFRDDMKGVMPEQRYFWLTWSVTRL